MNNYILYESLLSDIETTLQNGDAAIDPFNILEVYEIESDKEFNKIFDLIDIDKLFEKTNECKSDEWLCKLNIRIHEFLNLQKSDVFIRFVWWLTFKLIYERDTFCEKYLTLSLLDISEILHSKSLNIDLRLYIYKSVESTPFFLAKPSPAGVRFLSAS